MTNEKLIEKLYTAGRQIKDFDVSMSIVRREKGIPKILSNPEPDTIIAGLIYDLENEIREKGIKKAGKSDLLQAAKNILKSAKKCSYKPDLHTAFMCNENQVFCDGFQALILSGEKILDIETNPRTVFNVINSIPKTTEKTLVLPSIADLNIVLNEYKSLHTKQNPILRFYDEDKNLLIGFNPEFIINAIKATGSNTLHFNRHNTAALVKSENVDFLIMPVNVKSPETKGPGTYYYIDVDFTGVPALKWETVKLVVEKTA